MKILYFDVETTGLDPKENGIIQLAGMIEIDGEVVEEFNYQVKPIKGDVIEEEALKISGTKEEDLDNYPTPEDVHTSLLEMFEKYVDKFDTNDKFYPAGYNVKFDRQFLDSFFLKLGDKFFGSWVNHRIIDPLLLMPLAKYAGLIDSAENFKLVDICKAFDIKLDAHDASSDIKATRKVLIDFKERFKNEK